MSANFFVFIQYSIYEFLRSIGKKADWPSMEKLKLYKDEIVRQLDIKSLLKRIIFL